jgi:hypothetical protein
MAQGIESVLGPSSAFLMNLEEAEREMRDSAEALRSMLQRRTKQQRAKISLIRASTDRVSGLMYMQNLLRFVPLKAVSVHDPVYADKLYQEHGLIAYLQYINQPEFSVPKEHLPIWQVSRDCSLLIKTMPRAMHRPSTNDMEKFDYTESSPGDDAIDCSRYGLLSEHLQREAMIPLSDRVIRRAEALITPGMDDHTKIMIHRAAMEKEQNPDGDSGSRRPFGHNKLAVRRHLRSHITSTRPPTLRP